MKKPTSIGVERVKRDSKAKWTPRDALTFVLDAMDTGEIDPDAIMIVWRTKLPDNTTDVNAAMCCDSFEEQLGILEHAKMELYKAASEPD